MTLAPTPSPATSSTVRPSRNSTLSPSPEFPPIFQTRTHDYAVARSPRLTARSPCPPRTRARRGACRAPTCHRGACAVTRCHPIGFFSRCEREYPLPIQFINQYEFCFFSAFRRARTSLTSPSPLHANLHVARPIVITVIEQSVPSRTRWSFSRARPPSRATASTLPRTRSAARASSAALKPATCLPGSNRQIPPGLSTTCPASCPMDACASTTFTTRTPNSSTRS